MASEARRRSETKAAAVMAERDAGIARRQALEAARRRLQAHRVRIVWRRGFSRPRPTSPVSCPHWNGSLQARRAEAERSLKAAKAEADRIVEDLSRRGAALTSSADSLNVEQVCSLFCRRRAASCTTPVR